MAIIGLGTDLIEIIRIERIINRLEESLAKRILSSQEWCEYQSNSRQTVFLAKRFVAKEAAAKALGVGIRKGLALNQFEVFNNKLGKPELNLLGKAKMLADSLGVRHIHISLSDEQNYAYATVIMED